MMDSFSDKCVQLLVVGSLSLYLTQTTALRENVNAQTMRNVKLAEHKTLQDEWNMFYSACLFEGCDNIIQKGHSFTQNAANSLVSLDNEEIRKDIAVACNSALIFLASRFSDNDVGQDQRLQKVMSELVKLRDL